jgi:Leucine-rich repeat (LRR) protein
MLVSFSYCQKTHNFAKKINRFMKKKFIPFMLFAFFPLFKSQIVSITDSNFRSYLISNSEINTNNDNEIQVSEAIAFTGTIDIYNKNISDLTGIETFANLTGLQCSSNNLAVIDISKNTKLKSLYCGNNQLTSLDVSKNTELTNLYCENNKIASLDVSKITLLGAISCGGNQLLSLDISQNANFKWLYCPRNPLLTNLNLKNGNNAILTSIYVPENPNLTCIQVDDVNYANSQPSYLWQKDATASYNTNCLLSVNDINKKEITIFPNPAKDIINLSEEISNITISDLSGKIINQIPNSEKSINVSKLAKGNYIISAKTKTGETINKKFIKE